MNIQIPAIPGYQPKAECPACKKGRLRIVTRHESGNNGVMGPGGHSWSFNVIERLACDKCFASFEVDAKLRHQQLERFVQTQLERFKNPTALPKGGCPCGEEKLTKGEWSLSRGACSFRHEKTVRCVFLYCAGCYRVHWVEPPESPNAKRLESVLGVSVSKERAQ
jgi:hypothetical protein